MSVSYDVWIGVCVTVYVGAEVGKSDAVWIFEFVACKYWMRECAQQ